jgi:hypothetical protein
MKRKSFYLDQLVLKYASEIKTIFAKPELAVKVIATTETVNFKCMPTDYILHLACIYAASRISLNINGSNFKYLDDIIDELDSRGVDIYAEKTKKLKI